MKINDYAGSCGFEVELHSCVSEGYKVRWIAKLKYVEVKEGHLLISTHGSGTTPRKAMQDYIDAVKGKTLVFKASTDYQRREFMIPESLTP